jgi:hypothetical protein
VRLKNPGFVYCDWCVCGLIWCRRNISFCLSSESVQGFALTFECVYDIHGRYRFAPCVFRVRDGIADAIFQKDFQYTTGFFINQATDTFHSTTTGQTTNGRLGNALDVVAQYLAVTLGAAFAELLVNEEREERGCEMGNLAGIVLSNLPPCLLFRVQT